MSEGPGTSCYGIAFEYSSPECLSCDWKIRCKNLWKENRDGTRVSVVRRDGVTTQETKHRISPTLATSTAEDYNNGTWRRLGRNFIKGSMSTLGDELSQFMRSWKW